MPNLQTPQSIGGARRPGQLPTMQNPVPSFGANPINAFMQAGAGTPAAGNISSNTAAAYHRFNQQHGRLFAHIMGSAPSVGYTLKKVYEKDAEGKKIPLTVATQKAATEAEAKKAAGEGGAAQTANATKSKVKAEYKYHKELILKEGAPTKRKGAIIGIPKGSFENSENITAMINSGDYSFNPNNTDLVVMVVDSESLKGIMMHTFGNEIREADELNGGHPAKLAFGWKLPKGRSKETLTQEEKNKARSAGMQFYVHVHNQDDRKNVITADNFIPLYSATVSNSNKITKNDETRKEALYAIEQVVNKAEEEVRASLANLVTIENGIVTDSAILGGNTSVTKDVKTFTGEIKRDVRLPLKKKVRNKTGKYTYKVDKTGHLIGEQFGPDRDPRYSSILRKCFPSQEAYDQAIEKLKGLAKSGARKSSRNTSLTYFFNDDVDLLDPQDAANIMESLETLYSNSMYS